MVTQLPQVSTDGNFEKLRRYILLRYLCELKHKCKSKIQDYGRMWIISYAGKDKDTGIFWFS